MSVKDHVDAITCFNTMNNEPKSILPVVASMDKWSYS